jgi:hypothetical protein
MDLLTSNVEKVAVVLLFAGFALGVVAFLWLVVAAFRGARARGPLVLFAGAGLLLALPLIVAALHGRVADLGALVAALNGEVQVRLTPAGGAQPEALRVKVRAALNLVALTLGAIGLLWLLMGAFRQWSRVRWPVYLALAAALLIALPLGLNRLAQALVDLGPRERLVNGETHLTLTGWDRSDYSVLRARPHTIVLQMANADVTDDTLAYLEDMTDLRELDLSDTKVSDAGLAALRPLTSLQTLRLARTAITDAGFKEHIAPIESLQRLDLTGTEVSAEPLGEWRKAKPGRRALK